MKTGNLTPRSNNLVAGMRFTGAFAQPNGFGSVLSVEIKTDGRAVFTLTYKKINDESEHMWTIELDNEQRSKLAAHLSKHQPTLYEYY